MEPFFTRPISAVLWIAIAVVVLFKIPAVQQLLARRKLARAR